MDIDSLHGVLDVAATAAWDIDSFLTNAKATAQQWGGGLLALIGVVGLVFGGVKLMLKIMNGQKDQTSWLMIILMIIIGGALAAGGWTLISSVGSGGTKTINDLGNGGYLYFLLH